MDLEKAAQIGTVTDGAKYEGDFFIDNILLFSAAGEYRFLNELHYHILGSGSQPEDGAVCRRGKEIQGRGLYQRLFRRRGNLTPLAVSERPELYTAALHVSSQWGGFSENIK